MHTTAYYPLEVSFMPKLVLNNITSGYSSNTLLNSNFSAISTAIEDCVSRSGTAPNNMNADLDLNGYQLLNVSNISLTGSSGTLQGYVDDAEAFALESERWAHYPYNQLVPEGNLTDEYSSLHWATVSNNYATDSENSAIAAAASALAAAGSEAACATYSSLGFSTGIAYDFGSITDPVIIFPTDFGLVV